MSGRHHLRRTRSGVALVLVAVGAGGGAILAAAATGAPSQRVTLTVQRYFDPACTPLPGMAPTAARGGCEKLRFSGTISSGAPNEYVSVLHQRCGSTGLGTSLAGAQTRAGGAWEAEWWPAAGTFRARWGGSVSEPVRFRDSVRLSLTKLSASRQRVSVTGDQDMKGRVVELQRLVSGQWIPLRRVRLVKDRSSWGMHSSATFTVRQRGLILRVFVPAKSASPCYIATASETWTSGVRSGAPSAGGGRVIDRTLVCSTATQGGIRMVTIHASNASGAATVRRGPSFYVSTGHAGSLVSGSTSDLYLYPDDCTETRSRVPLLAGKLKGGSLGPSGREFECQAPPRVLLRVRAEFDAPTTLDSSRERGYQLQSAHGEISKASIAIRTQAGKPLAFATVSESGRARLFTAPTCREDTT